jgi:hypothetical protein
VALVYTYTELNIVNTLETSSRFIFIDSVKKNFRQGNMKILPR